MNKYKAYDLFDYFDEPNYNNGKYKFGMRLFISANPQILMFPMNKESYKIIEVFL